MLYVWYGTVRCGGYGAVGSMYAVLVILQNTRMRTVFTVYLPWVVTREILAAIHASTLRCSIRVQKR